jgi:dihydrofolate reductase
MYVTLIAVISLDGKLTKANETDQNWASKEDHEHLTKLIDNNNLLIMGRNTYEIVKSKPKEGKLKIVLTSDPKKFSDQHLDGIEFSNENPNQLIKRLESLGYKKVLILGGSKIYGLFLKYDLVDEIELTVEPYIFGSGTPFISIDKLNKKLKLNKVSKLNENGTILLNYSKI